MSGFTKLVPEIVQSSIWNESPEVRVVWITMLAIKDQNGYVRGNAETLARIGNVTLESVNVALERFQSPDIHSHTPDYEGRRIEPMPGGWLVLNHDKYRLHDDLQREKTRERVKKHREKALLKQQCNVTETLPSASASASASVSVSERGMQGGVELPFQSDPFREAWREWREHRRKIKRPMTENAEKRAIAKLPVDEAEAIRWIHNAIDAGWRGIYKPAARQDVIPVVAPDDLFCTIRTTAGDYPITKKQVDEWQTKFPGCAVADTITREIVEEMRVRPLRPEAAMVAILRKIVYWEERAKQ